MKRAFYFFFSLAFLLLSCTGNNEPGVITFNLKRSDYIEKIIINGTVQAVLNIPVNTPQRVFGQMTVFRLAEDGSTVKKGDTLCMLTVPELQSNYENLITSKEKLEAELNKTEADNHLNIALLEAQLASSNSLLKIALLDSVAINYDPEVKRRLMALQMKKAMIEKQKTEKKVKAQRNINETVIRQLRARIMSENLRAQSILDMINSLVIIAQRDGIVMRAESPLQAYYTPQGLVINGGTKVKEGTTMYPGRPILQFPDLSKMQISAEVYETDFRKIEKGQKVIIKIDAGQMLATTGIINRKNLISKTTQMYSDTKVKLYEVIIDVDSCHSEMKPGLSAVCEVMVKKVPDTLFVPTLAIFERDSSKVVYIKEKDKFTPVKVETGSTGDYHTIISAGLKGGEVIALSEPADIQLTIIDKADSLKKSKTNQTKSK
jgi:HlyD family secretion protein